MRKRHSQRYSKEELVAARHLISLGHDLGKVAEILERPILGLNAKLYFLGVRPVSDRPPNKPRAIERAKTTSKEILVRTKTTSKPSTRYTPFDLRRIRARLGLSPEAMTRVLNHELGGNWRSNTWQRLERGEIEILQSMDNRLQQVETYSPPTSGRHARELGS